MPHQHNLKQDAHTVVVVVVVVCMPLLTLASLVVRVGCSSLTRVVSSLLLLLSFNLKLGVGDATAEEVEVPLSSPCSQ